MSVREITLWFDGCCEPRNPRGISAYGFVIKEDGETIKEGSGIAAKPFSKWSSNNVAEYTGVIEALQYLKDNGITDALVVAQGDSQLIIRQLQGRYAVRSTRLLPRFQKARELLEAFTEVRLHWVPREENKKADALTHKVYKVFLDTHPGAREKVAPYLATEKQKAFMEDLGIDYYEYISKYDASRFISNKLDERRGVT